jgi:hypothetical protein
MPIDFKTRQIRSHKIIASGSDDKPWLLVYPSGSATDDSGGIDPSKYSGAGTDTWAWISGSIGGNERVVFGGDIYVSGSLSVSGTFAITASAGGSNGQVQFNDSGALNGDSGFNYNKTTNALSSSFIIATTGFSGSLTKLADGSSYLIGSGSTEITTGSNGAVTVATPLYVLNESVSFSPTLGIWYGTLAYAPNPTTSLMLFHNGQLLTQGPSDDYSLSGATIQMSNLVDMDSGDRIFAMYQRQ